MTRRLLKARHVDFQPRSTFYGEKDRFTFDFLHRNGHPHVLQCISFDVDIDAVIREAKVLTYSATDIRERGKKEDDADLKSLEITALIDPPEGDSERFTAAKVILSEVATIKDAKHDLEQVIAQM